MTKRKARRVPHSKRKRMEGGYGAFPGGDPRLFEPDPECSTDEERAAHARACEVWERGETEPLPPSHQWVAAVDARQALDEGRASIASFYGAVAHMEVEMFGLGTYRYRVPMISRRKRRVIEREMGF